MSTLSELADRCEKATEWRPIPEWPYEASDTGSVRSIRTGKILKYSLSHNGYERVMFSVDRARSTFRVHRLVAVAWLGSIPEGMHVNHKDGNKRNNQPGNLEIVTAAENERHAVENNLKATGDRNGTKTIPHRVARGVRASLAKLTDADVLEIRSRSSRGESDTSLATSYCVDRSAIYQIKKRLTWTHV